MMTESEYNDFCARAEEMRVYDGRGTYDMYECTNGCGHKMITTYQDKGVTPFTMGCPECGKTMYHVRTFKHINPIVRVHKWVRPNYSQYCRLSPSLQYHVDSGGLLLEENIPTHDIEASYEGDELVIRIKSAVKDVKLAVEAINQLIVEIGKEYQKLIDKFADDAYPPSEDLPIESLQGLAEAVLELRKCPDLEDLVEILENTDDRYQRVTPKSDPHKVLQRQLSKGHKSKIQWNRTRSNPKLR